jgi:pimeloyl-ACP methyl ester carboxylesterase
LQQFWGDPLCVRDSDALRFQWPAIAAGWENGLLDFSRAQTMNYEEDGLHDDTVLLRRVLELPNCRVFVIQGSNDRVVPASRTRKFLKEFQDRVPIMELEGLGHDPFEENTESFCRAVDEILKQNLS